MVAMGWGVVRDSLGSALYQITFMGLLFCGVTAVRDTFAVVAVTEVGAVSLSEEDELIDFVLILTPLIILINLIFYVWIIGSLKATTAYLRNMNQASKLKRHLRLRCLIVASLVIAGGWVVFQVIDMFADVLTPDQEWYVLKIILFPMIVRINCPETHQIGSMSTGSSRLQCMPTMYSF
jgi:hypothetical protein